MFEKSIRLKSSDVCNSGDPTFGWAGVRFSRTDHFLVLAPVLVLVLVRATFLSWRGVSYVFCVHWPAFTSRSFASAIVTG